MTGSYFFQAIKTDRLLREHFEAWIKERRNDFSHELEGAAGEIPVYRAQGKIFALDVLTSMLEQALNLPADDPAISQMWRNPLIRTDGHS